MNPTAAFVFNLVQDVNILRPVAVMAARDFGFRPLFLIFAKFEARDRSGIWQSELEELALSLGAEVRIFHSASEATNGLSDRGILFAASETHLPNHSTVHDLFRACPPTYLRVTMQHGFECVGYLHSADHAIAHGQTASFGADYVCAWSGISLRSMAPSQRPKLLVTGSTAVLQLPEGEGSGSTGTGLVCENLHSVRFRGRNDRVSEFVQTFVSFCNQIKPSKVALRPHPGGQYVLKNEVRLPRNAYVENTPAYRLDLRQFAYGISAPSSALIDMLLAGIPTAVWRDEPGSIDSDNYAGLTSVTTPREWMQFATAAIADPLPFRERQSQFIEQTGLIVDAAEVHSRLAALFETAARREVRPLGSIAQRHRFQFVANSRVPTLQLSFEKPLKGPEARGEVFSNLLTEQEIRATAGILSENDDLRAWVVDRLERTQPTAIIFCRYSGAGWRPMVDWAKARAIPIVYHIDDDLLAIPRDIGERKYAMHNAPERLEAVRSLLEAADLVYCSTERLKNRLLGYLPKLNAFSGRIYCSGSILRRPSPRDEVTVGYMASADHAHNLDMVLPAIERLLDANENVRFELFGSIPTPARLQRFGERISTAPRVEDYANFLREFAARKWDVGICPLVPIEFNLMKADTKWVEYSSAGVAVVASRGTVYDDCCAHGCGILADGADEWFEALDLLVRDAERRCLQVMRAQALLEKEYSLVRLRSQVFDAIALASDRAIQLNRSENLEKA